MSTGLKWKSFRATWWGFWIWEKFRFQMFWLWTGLGTLFWLNKIWFGAKLRELWGRLPSSQNPLFWGKIWKFLVELDFGTRIFREISFRVWILGWFTFDLEKSRLKLKQSPTSFRDFENLISSWWFWIPRSSSSPERRLISRIFCTLLSFWEILLGVMSPSPSVFERFSSLRKSPLRFERFRASGG